MVWSENFHFKPFPDSCTKREKESLWLRLCRSTNPQIYELITPSTSPTSPIMPLTSPIYEPTNQSSTQSLRPTNLRLRRRPRAFAPRTDLWPRAFDPSICVILIDPRNHKPFISDFFIVVVAVWVVVFWWFSGCVVVGFVWVVVENSIFIMQPNTWKYFPFLKIAFPENIYFPENILHEPNAAIVTLMSFG